MQSGAPNPMTPVDPKLVALARSVRPDLVQRLIVLRATEAGRGILVGNAGGPATPPRPPLPSRPDPTVAKAAALVRQAPGIADRPHSVALSSYAEDGAAAPDGSQAGRSQHVASAPAQERSVLAVQPKDIEARGVPFAHAGFPPAASMEDGIDPGEPTRAGKLGRGTYARAGLPGAVPLSPASQASLVALFLFAILLVAACYAA
jgi:hypothetical protein